MRIATSASPLQLPMTTGAVPAICLVGNPNVGKSALFSALTGRFASISNYPGTTVEITRGALATADQPYTLVDTPGVYSLLVLSDDERVTRDILLREPPATVVLVVDAKQLRRGLLLALELSETGLPFVVALNMSDEAATRGIQVDHAALAQQLGVPVIATVATRKDGLGALTAAVSAARCGQLQVTYAAPIEEAILSLTRLLPVTGIHARSLSAMFLAGADDVLVAWPLPAAEQGAMLAIRAAAAQACDEPLALAIQHARLAVAADLAGASMRRRAVRPVLAARLGRLAVDPLWGWPILGAVLLALYWFVGVIGAGWVVDLLQSSVFDRVINPALRWLVDAVVPIALLRAFLVGDYGLFTVALTYSFAIVLPIVGTFFLAFGLLEDSGYLPRLAVMLDRSFRLLGLNGKAVLPMVLGLGCGTMATVATRMLATRKERIQATLLLALGVPCSAQLGVLLGMVGAEGLVAVLIWGGVVLATMLAVGWLAARVIPGETSAFLLELPPMRWPAAGNVLLKTAVRLEWYLKEVVPVFVLGTAFLFACDTLGVLAWMEAALAPVVVGWLGLPPAATGALLVGFLRRDYGAAGLFALHIQGALDPVQVVVSMVVVTLFVPCIANLFMIAKEHGGRVAWAVAVTVFPIAILIGGLLNLVLRTFPVLNW